MPMNYWQRLGNDLHLSTAPLFPFTFYRTIGMNDKVDGAYSYITLSEAFRLMKNSRSEVSVTNEW